ncbi:predicted protein [Postia placenta Mad-698-R]|nr:predicted protein [Postia placenta Mad-698-R]
MTRGSLAWLALLLAPALAQCLRVSWPLIRPELFPVLEARGWTADAVPMPFAAQRARGACVAFSAHGRIQYYGGGALSLTPLLDAADGEDVGRFEFSSPDSRVCELVSPLCGCITLVDHLTKLASGHPYWEITELREGVSRELES